MTAALTRVRSVITSSAGEAIVTAAVTHGEAWIIDAPAESRNDGNGASGCIEPPMRGFCRSSDASVRQTPSSRDAGCAPAVAVDLPGARNAACRAKGMDAVVVDLAFALPALAIALAL